MDYRVFFVEEPVVTETQTPWLEVREDSGVQILIPRLPASEIGSHAEVMAEVMAEATQRKLLDGHLATEGVRDPLLWFYTPMSIALADNLEPALTVYDCMDQLSAFKGAPPQLVERERELLAKADLLFTGGYSLYEEKRKQHPNAHPFPSSVDVEHFAAARSGVEEPEDQARIPGPRLGFYGVIDERFDIELIDALARTRPEWQFVLIGPVVKIDPALLPRRPNIHYLGPKVYDELPHYLAGWDAALMPFALNESTRFISPTKTPEYLAAGRPVVSTPIADVVRTYGDTGIVKIAHSPQKFIDAVEEALAQNRDRETLLNTADRVLSDMSWDRTLGQMKELITSITVSRANPSGVASVPSGERRHVPPGAGFDYLIVGAGFSGSVLAERLASVLGKRVLIIDRRPHIGGNAYDHYNDDGILVHRYGPHIFHTNAPRLVEYLSRFTRWRPYEHRVLAQVDAKLVPMPINLTTLNRLYDLDLTAQQAEDFLASRAERVAAVLTSEDVVVSQIGRELYEKFFRGYSRKQWGLDPSALDKSVTARVPTRTNTDDRYFLDSFQKMPLHGYTRMFENMLDHPNIKVLLNTSFEEIRNEVRYDRLIYCGPIDEYFGYRFGRLPYRSLRFQHETVDREVFQPVAVVNHPSEEVPHTRVTEYKHLTGQQHRKTAITYEFPSSDGDPYYPVPCPENAALYKQYQALANAHPEVMFVGRLGTYRYYNMDQVVGQALALFARIAGSEQAEESQRLTGS